MNDDVGVLSNPRGLVGRSRLLLPLCWVMYGCLVCNDLYCLCIGLCMGVWSAFLSSFTATVSVSIDNPSQMALVSTGADPAPAISILTTVVRVGIQFKAG